MTACLRTMSLDDYAGCCALWQATEHLAPSPEPDGFAAFLARNQPFCQVAEDEGRIVGALLASFDGIRGYLYRLAVDRACRRRGIGAKLVAASEAALRAAGARRINLHVFSDNAAALDFWRSHGWSGYTDVQLWAKALDQ